MMAEVTCGVCFDGNVKQTTGFSSPLLETKEIEGREVKITKVRKRKALKN